MEPTREKECREGRVYPRGTPADREGKACKGKLKIKDYLYTARHL